MSASASSSTQSSGVADLDSVLLTFLALLASAEPGPISLPRETLLGAVTHFLTHLPEQQLGSFVGSLSTSPRLWNGTWAETGDLQNAVVLAVVARAGTGKERRWLPRLGRSSLDGWVHEVVQALNGQDEMESPDAAQVGKINLLVGVLRGLEEAKIRDRARGGVEAAAILELAAVLEDSGITQENKLDREQKEKGKEREHEPSLRPAAPHMAAQDALAAFCEAADLIDPKRLRALDLDHLLPHLVAALHRTLLALDASRALSTETNEAALASSALARGIGTVFRALAGGDQPERRYGWKAMTDFCEQMREVGERLRAEQSGQPEQAFESGKTALFSFLLPGLSILDILLDPAAIPPPSSEPSSSTMFPPSPQAAIASHILLSLSAFARLIDTAEDGLEGYHRLLLGSLDVLIAHSGAIGIHTLLQHAKARMQGDEHMSPAEAGWWMRLGELALGEVDAWGVREALLPLVQRHIIDTNHKRSFEAALTLLGSLTERAGATLDQSAELAPFLDEVVPYYSGMLLRLGRRGDITADEMKQGYAIAVEAAANRESALMWNLVDRLKANSTSPPVTARLRPPQMTRKGPAADEATALEENQAWQLSLLRVRLAIVPTLAKHVTRDALREYLDEVGDSIMLLEEARKAELVEAAWKVVAEDVGDAGKGAVVEWWIDWRERYIGRSERKEFKARL